MGGLVQLGRRLPALGRRTLERWGIAICAATILATILLDISLVRELGGVAIWDRKADFVIVLSGAAILDEHAPAILYDEQAQRAAQAGVLHAAGLRSTELLPYNHPPIEAMLVSRLQSFGWSAEACFLLWIVLSLLAVVVALVLLIETWTSPSSRLLTVLAALSFVPLSTSILLGQSTAFVLLGWAVRTVLLRRGTMPGRVRRWGSPC